MAAVRGVGPVWYREVLTKASLSPQCEVTSSSVRLWDRKTMGAFNSMEGVEAFPQSQEP